MKNQIAVKRFTLIYNTDPALPVEPKAPGAVLNEGLRMFGEAVVMSDYRYVKPYTYVIEFWISDANVDQFNYWMGGHGRIMKVWLTVEPTSTHMQAVA